MQHMLWDIKILPTQILQPATPFTMAGRGFSFVRPLESFDNSVNLRSQESHAFFSRRYLSFHSFAAASDASLRPW